MKTLILAATANALADAPSSDRSISSPIPKRVPILNRFAASLNKERPHAGEIRPCQGMRASPALYSSRRDRIARRKIVPKAQMAPKRTPLRLNTVVNSSIGTWVMSEASVKISLA